MHENTLLVAGVKRKKSTRIYSVTNPFHLLDFIKKLDFNVTMSHNNNTFDKSIEYGFDIIYSHKKTDGFVSGMYRFVLCKRLSDAHGYRRSYSHSFFAIL